MSSQNQPDIIFITAKPTNWGESPLLKEVLI